MYTAPLGALEQLVVDVEVHLNLGMYGWWLLVPNWATSRFSDHRRLKPNDLQDLRAVVDMADLDVAAGGISSTTEKKSCHQCVILENKTVLHKLVLVISAKLKW